MAADIDWSKAGKEERQVLYRSIKRLIDRSSHTWESILLEDLQHPHVLVSSFQDNLRAGRIKRQTAARLYEWLKETDPALADETHDAIVLASRSRADRTTWEELIALHATQGELQLKLIPRERGMIDLTIDPSKYEVINPGDRYRLAFTAPFNGYCVAVQWFSGRWYPLPLSYSGTATPVKAGQTSFPQHDDVFIEAQEDAAPSLVYRLAILLHRDIDVLARLDFDWHQPIPLPVLDGLAAETVAKPEGSWRLAQLNLMHGSKLRKTRDTAGRRSNGRRRAGRKG